MRSELAEFINLMQHIADEDKIVIAARHIDVLEYYFKAKQTPEQAYQQYKNNFLPRWNALTENGKYTEPS